MIRGCCSADQQSPSHRSAGDSAVRRGESAHKPHRAGPGAPTREQLVVRARQLDIQGRSGMTKEELLEAVERAEARRLEAMSLADLRECAHAFDIEGRSKMSRDELVQAIRRVRKPR